MLLTETPRITKDLRRAEEDFALPAWPGLRVWRGVHNWLPPVDTPRTFPF